MSTCECFPEVDGICPGDRETDSTAGKGGKGVTSIPIERLSNPPSTEKSFDGKKVVLSLRAANCSSPFHRGKGARITIIDNGGEPVRYESTEKKPRVIAHPMDSHRLR